MRSAVGRRHDRWW